MADPRDAISPTPTAESTLARIQRTPTYVIAREFDDMATALAEQAKTIEADTGHIARLVRETVALESKAASQAREIEGHKKYIELIEGTRDRARDERDAMQAEVERLTGVLATTEAAARLANISTARAVDERDASRGALAALFPEPVKNADGSWTTERADLELEGALEDVRRGKADKIVADTLTRVLIKLNTARAALPPTQGDVT